MIIKYQDRQLYPKFSIHVPHNIGGINGDVNSDLATLFFKNKEQIEDFS